MSALRGFSLVELVAALLIAAILLLVALPGYRQSVVRANRAVAKLALLEVAARQERYLQENKRYAAGLAALGFPGNYYIDGAANLVSEGEAVYHISLLLEGGDYYGVIASPRNGQGDDLACGSFIYHQSGERAVSGQQRGNPSRCW